MLIETHVLFSSPTNCTRCAMATKLPCAIPRLPLRISGLFFTWPKVFDVKFFLVPTILYIIYFLYYNIGVGG